MKIIDIKHCSRCKHHKMRTEFSANWTTTDGLCSWCKQCTREHRRMKKNSLQPVPVPAC